MKAPQLTGAEPPTTNQIPLAGWEAVSLRDADAASLISVLADIVEAACVSIAQPYQNAEAA